MGCTPAPDPPCEVAISHIALPWTASNVPFLSGRNELYRIPQISSGEIMPPQNGILVTIEVKAELAEYRGGYYLADEGPERRLVLGSGYL